MFKKIRDAKDLEALLRAWHGKRATTNFFLTEDVYLSMIKQCAVMRFENGCYLIFEKQNHYDFYFFLQKGTLPVAVPQMPKPLVLEQVCLERKGQEPKASFWENVGFVPYLERKRLVMPLQDGISATSAVQFATSSQADTILEMMQNMFEPYTSALPTKKELLASIAKKEVLVAQENEQLLGFLRYGAEKKVSVLWQIAVSKQARGKGIGSMLVKHWIWQVKDDALRCQLWVRTDNQAAQRMYEMLGFLPDGRIAPVMIKKEKGMLKMESLLKILAEIRPDVDFEDNKELVDSGELDSFDIVTLVGELCDAYEIEIGADDIVPENFNSVEAIMALVTRLQED